MCIRLLWGRFGRRLFSTLVLAQLSTGALAVSQAEVDSLNGQCEDAREKQLAPIRAQKTQSCIEQKTRAPDHCERFYATYGNTSMVGGMRRQGLYYDLPECLAFLDAQTALQASRSRSR